MLKYRQLATSLLVFLALANKACAFSEGILNTQTIAGNEAAKVKKNLATKKDEIGEEIEKYKDAIKVSNQKIKLSIKQMKMVIELKKDTLIQIEKLLHNTTNDKELR